MVCSEELPAQWQKLPLRTQQEMRAGRASIDAEEVKRVTMSRWADEGGKFLRDRFGDSGLKFHTSWNTEAGTITLTVYRTTSVPAAAPLRSMVRSEELLFTETCPAENFVSYLMLTKVMMVM